MANILLLNLKEIGRWTLEMLAYLFLAGLLVVIFFVGILLNCKDTHCLKDLLSLLAINFFHLNWYTADKNFQAANSNSAIYRMLLAILFSKEHCLINTTILRKEHMIFLASSSKYWSISNKKIGQKLLSHNCGFADWLAA